MTMAQEQKWAIPLQRLAIDIDEYNPTLIEVIKALQACWFTSSVNLMFTRILLELERGVALNWEREREREREREKENRVIKQIFHE